MKGRPKAGSPSSLLREALANEHLPGGWGTKARKQIKAALKGRTREAAAKVLGMDRVVLQRLLAQFLPDELDRGKQE